jgi:ribosome biogenesis GTPase
MKGKVMRSTGSFYDVLGEDGNKYICRVRGKIRLEGIRETNPVAVGDLVIFDTEHKTGSITEILQRNNHMLRQSVKKSAHSHVLAANVDQAMVVVTITKPRTSLGFIDRFLVSAEAFRIPQLIVFNKEDLWSEEERSIVSQLIQLYTPLGITCFVTSATTEPVDAILQQLQHKTTLITGHSGVGKSTLLNRFSSSITQTVGDISDFTEKGMHTTTFAEMFELNDSTYVIDTPGVKEWGLVNMEKEEISDYFPEMRALCSQCKYGASCLHIHEPQCAIHDAVREGKIAASRFDSYASMLLGEDNRK